MNFQRYLCSDLVVLRNNSKTAVADLVVNLEEIWQTGAIIEVEEPVEPGVIVELRCGPVFFAGRVTQVEQHESGWRAEVAFSPLTPWTLDKFQPRHLLNLSDLGKREI
jgi:hypothetical protein